MNYCTLEDAWGDSFKESRKKKKSKRLYTSKLPKHIYNRSHEEGSQDKHCRIDNNRHFSVKNKYRHDKSRNSKNIFNPKKQSRVDNINIVYDQANEEYKRYKKDTRNNTRGYEKENNFIKNQGINSNYEPEDYTVEESQYDLLPNNYFTETDNDTDYDTDNENQNMNILMEQNIQAQRQLNESQNNNMNQINRPAFQMSNSPSYNLDNIEGFENSNSQLNSLELENKINDVDAYPLFDEPAISPSYENNDINNLNNTEIIDSEEEDTNEIVNTNEMGNTNQIVNTKKRNNRSKKNNRNNRNKKTNLLDNLLNNNSQNDEDSDSDDSEDSSIENEKLELVDENSKDIDYRLSTLNRNVNLIIKKMNNSQFFEDESQDNIHDLILFVLFGIFIIFVLDTIYRFGRNSGK